MSHLIVEIKMLHPDARKPEYQTAGASGMDLHVLNIAEYTEGAGEWDYPEDPDTGKQVERFCRLHLAPGGRALAQTGIALQIPAGWEGQVRPRSGRAWHEGLTVLNSPGTLDCDFVGEIKVILVNLGKDSVEIKRGDRIAQLVFAPVGRATLQPVERFSTETMRGEKGFGSSGI